VKLPREISHERRLRDAMQPLERFLEGVLELGKARAVTVAVAAEPGVRHGHGQAFLRPARAPRPMSPASRATQLVHAEWMRF
jgi:uncharacterized protein YecE (DUF72 family)